MTLCTPMVRGLVRGTIDGDGLFELYRRTMAREFGQPQDVILRLSLMLDAVLASLDRYSDARLVGLGPEGLPVFTPSLPIVAAVCRPPIVGGRLKFDSGSLLDTALRHERGEDVFAGLLTDSLQRQVPVH